MRATKDHFQKFDMIKPQINNALLYTSIIMMVQKTQDKLTIQLFRQGWEM